MNQEDYEKLEEYETKNEERLSKNHKKKEKKKFPYKTGGKRR